MIILAILIHKLLYMYSRLLQKVYLVYFEFLLLFYVYKASRNERGSLPLFTFSTGYGPRRRLKKF
jgi:uncharacterized membrane protein